MKAAFYEKYGPPEVVQFKDMEKPTPLENELLIRIHATTVTAVDCIFRNGRTFFARMATGVLKPKQPVLGTEFSGEIEAVGKNVTLFQTGDQVFGDSGTIFGAHAEYICISEDEPIETLPRNLSLQEAAAVPYGTLTALPFLRDKGNISHGKHILIIGAAGAIGSYSVQLAKFFGARVTGVCSSANVELVRTLGADKVIDYSRQNYLNSEEQYDIIFDTPGKSSFLRCRHLLLPDGIYLTTVLQIPILIYMAVTSKTAGKKAILAFTGLRSSDDKKKDLRFIKELIENGKIRPVIDRTFPFEQIVRAHEYVEKGHKKGNVVILMAQE